MLGKDPNALLDHARHSTEPHTQLFLVSKSSIRNVVTFFFLIRMKRFKIYCDLPVRQKGMDHSMRDLEELGAERGFLPGG